MSIAETRDPSGPPPPDRRQAAPPVVREYRREALVVVWQPDRCIHSGRCVRSLPRVFDPHARPWVDMGAAELDAIAAAVHRCPTGALHYRWEDGAHPPEAPGTPPRVAAQHDGPLYVSGDVVVEDEAGGVLRRDLRLALCRCGASQRKPFCDNSHRAAGFRDPRPVANGAPA